MPPAEIAPLPLDPELPRILDLLAEAGSIVVVAEPGAGKTTRIPPRVLDAVGSNQKVYLLQPRRIAAQAAAARIAYEKGWTLGEEVGYSVRFESQCRRSTRLQVMTEGVLLRRLQGDPFLEGVGAVILDEFHERGLTVDLVLGLLREVRQASRGDLKLLVLSATLEAEPVADFLGGCPVVRVPGRCHPVERVYRGHFSSGPLESSVVTALEEYFPRTAGHTLVFLPGRREIRLAARALSSFAAAHGARVFELHGGLPLQAQAKVLEPSRQRKIILTTNVAETSITVEGADLVVDSGLVRLLKNDLRHGIDRLETERISQHSADQRAGRAGRLGPGLAVRLWSKAEQGRLALETAPEIRRVDLASAVLELRAWGVVDASTFGWLEAPSRGALERAEALLRDLGAVEAGSGRLTSLGRRLLVLPAHPRVGRLLLAAQDAGAERDGALVAALLEERDVLRALSSVDTCGPSDVLLRRDLVVADHRGEGNGRLDPAAARSVRRTARDLLRSMSAELGAVPGDRGAGPSPRDSFPRDAGPDLDEALLRALLSAYPDRVARRRGAGSDRALLVGGRGLRLARDSVVRDGEFFVAVVLDDTAGRRQGETLVRLASRVERAWIEEMFAENVSVRSQTFFDESSEKVRSTATWCYRDLPLEEPRELPPPLEAAETLLTAVVKERLHELLPRGPVTDWLRRVRCLGQWRPDLALPRFERGELEQAAELACRGKSRLAEVRSVDWLALLRSMLPYERVRLVDELAPESLAIPSGRRARLVYREGFPPTLSARVQELFGLHETPRIAGGSVAVLVELLGPNFRPVQLTQDLKSFWSTTYAVVRKELRGRYPKHAWPEDPWTAVATRR